MKKTSFIFFFLFICDLALFSQIDVNIDSLYQVFSSSSKYDLILRAKLFTMDSEWDTGFVITTKLDTIKGQIKLLGDGIHVKVRNNQLDKKYRADKYIRLQYGYRIFISKTLENFPVNAELLDSGKINFYSFETANTNYTQAEIATRFYLEKDKIIYGPYHSDWKDFGSGFTLLSECIGDYKTLSNRVQNKEFKYSDLWIIIKIYNYWYKKNFR